MEGITEKKQIEEFKKEILTTEELVPYGWKILKSDKLLKADIPPSEFLVDKLIPKNGITIIAGNPSTGKSWILLEIAKCVSSNRFLFGKFDTKEQRFF